MPFIPELSWLQWGLIFVALVALYLTRRRFYRLYARLMKPSRDHKARWLSLATRDDVNSSAEGVKASTKSLIESLVDKLLAKLVEKLPMVVSNDLIDRVVAGLPDAIEEQMRESVSNLTAQVRSLRAERDKLNKELVPVPVHMYGFKISDEDEEKHYFAFVMLNRKTGEASAPNDRKNRRIVSYSSRGYDWSPSKRLGVDLPGGAPVGAPWFHKVQGDPRKVVMLGETYWVG